MALTTRKMTPKLAPMESGQLLESIAPKIKPSQVALPSYSLDHPRLMRPLTTPPTSPHGHKSENTPLQRLSDTGIVTPSILTPPDTPTVARNDGLLGDLQASEPPKDEGEDAEHSPLIATLSFNPTAAEEDYAWRWDPETGRVNLPVCGRGAWSTVYASVPAQLLLDLSSLEPEMSIGTAYALKVYSRKDPEASAVLHNEALILSYLASIPATKPYTIPFYGLDARRNALVLEYAPSSLDATVQQAGALGTVEWSQMACQLLQGLAAIHDAHVIHADIKPSNILLSPTPGSYTYAGLPKLRYVYADFSSSHLDIPGVPQIDASGNTYEYMAPELFSSSRAIKETRKSDVFALGVTLLFAALGQSPYHGMHRMQIINMARAGQVLDCAEITSQNPGAWKETRVRMVIERMVAKKAEERWSAQRLCEVLEK